MTTQSPRASRPLIIITLASAVALCGFGVVQSTRSAPAAPVAAAAANPAPLLPNPALTPGDTLAVTAADVCVAGYSGKVRNVPSSVKAQVYKEYGILHRKPGEYEVDHLISLELGGSNSIKNLWPQSYKTQPWNAHVKDKLENELHKRVCAGQMTLTEAQTAIRTDWIAEYKKLFGDKPVAGPPTQ